MSSNKEKIFEFVDNIIKQPLNDEVKAKKIVDFVLNLDISKSYKSTSLTNIKNILLIIIHFLILIIINSFKLLLNFIFNYTILQLKTVITNKQKH